MFGVLEVIFVFGVVLISLLIGLKICFICYLIRSKVNVCWFFCVLCLFMY